MLLQIVREWGVVVKRLMDVFNREGLSPSV